MRLAGKDGAVERFEYERLNALESEMWWFGGLHTNLLNLALRHTLRPDGNILDAGCGTGGLLLKLAQARPQHMVIGLDRDAGACEFARAKSMRPVCRGSIDALPFAAGSFATIVSADVLCHASVNEESALQDFHRCLERGGVLILNLPAYQWMMSGHDRAVHTARRYTRGRVRRLLAAAGFADIRTTCWNTVLFPLMAAHRLLSRGARESDVQPFASPLEYAFRGVMHFESLLLKLGVNLPYGGSILAVATKP
jgi:SAM-dependent methyltransferase